MADPLIANFVAASLSRELGGVPLLERLIASLRTTLFCRVIAPDKSKTVAGGLTSDGLSGYAILTPGPTAYAQRHPAEYDRTDGTAQ